MFFRKPHPWDPHYAIPNYVLKEPPLRGTFTSPGLPRGTIDAPALAPPWKPGYAYPPYLAKEPLGRGVYRTKYTPRKTIDTYIPRYLSGLGDIDFESDAIASFGRNVSIHIMSSIYTLPPHQRKYALKALFDQLDPKLWGRVSSKASRLVRERDMGPKEALEKAIAAATSQGLLEEFMALGRGEKPKVKSMIGLACYGEAAENAVATDTASALGFCGPICLVKKAGGALASGAGAVTGAVSGATSQAYSWARGAVSMVGKLACGVASSDVGKIAAGAGGAAAGGTAGAAAATKGTDVVQGMCADEKTVPIPPPPPPQPSIPIVPIAIGGAALVAVVLLTR